MTHHPYRVWVSTRKSETNTVHFRVVDEEYGYEDEPRITHLIYSPRNGWSGVLQYSASRYILSERQAEALFVGLMKGCFM